ncbi:MAG TPA: sigma-54 dependent transcriptional regulator [Myxococcales bacterium]|jgi:DNA-binding NtrC family response regulator
MTIQTLLVDDDRSFSALAAAALQREGFPVAQARSLHEARAAVAKEAPLLVILDRRLPDGDGLAFLPELKQLLPGATVVMVTAYGDVSSAVDAMRAGAADYLVKPVELADLVMKAKRTVEAMRLRDRLQAAEAELQGRHHLILPRSASMKKVLEMLARIAGSPRSAVLLLGETGSGKEVLARHLHAQSAGGTAPFVHVNCAAVPANTFESELFGHERGAFTDAKGARRGLVEVASGGTLFLDEVGELPLALQAKLLTFLDSGRFRRLGGVAELTSSARIVAATNRELQAQIQEGTFREDLWFRLSVFKIDVPPLRERREDVVPLAEGILSDLRAELGRRSATLSELGRARLSAYAFPGNVRELRNVLERALVLEPGPDLALEMLEGTPRDCAPGSGSADFRVSGPPIKMDELERRYARWVLEQLGGRRMEAARAMDISYPTFLKRIEGS